jgi:hypothetical protein
MRAIRDAARKSNVHPDGVYATAAARIMCSLHPSVRARATGRDTPLSVNHGLVSPSGGFKSTGVGVGEDITPFPSECGELDLEDAVPWWRCDSGVDLPMDDSIYEAGLGTSEGLMGVFLRPAPKEVIGMGEGGDLYGPPPVPVLPRRTRSMVTTTEGSQLSRLKGRNGGDYISGLLQAFSADSQGNTNADVERNRKLKKNTYRQCLVMAMQFSVVSSILLDKDLGFPQRFRFFVTGEESDVTDEERTAQLRTVEEMTEEEAVAYLEGAGINESGLDPDDPDLRWLVRRMETLALLRNVTFSFPAKAVAYMHALNQTSSAPGAELDGHAAAHLIRIAVEQEILAADDEAFEADDDLIDFTGSGHPPHEIRVSLESWEAARVLAGVSSAARDYAIARAEVVLSLERAHLEQQKVQGSAAQARAQAQARELPPEVSACVNSFKARVVKGGTKGVGKNDVVKALHSQLRPFFSRAAAYLLSTGEIKEKTGPRGGVIYFV